MSNTVISQQQQVGSVSSASVPVPVNADGTLATNPSTGQPYRFILIHGTASPVDAADPTKSCILYVRISWDGINYAAFQNAPWAGGLNKFGQPNQPDFNVSIPVDADGKPPQRVMVTLDTLGLNTGLTIDFR